MPTEQDPDTTQKKSGERTPWGEWNPEPRNQRQRQQGKGKGKMGAKKRIQGPIKFNNTNKNNNEATGPLNRIIDLHLQHRQNQLNNTRKRATTERVQNFPI